VVVGPIAGLASVGYVRMVTWADRHRPEKLGPDHGTDHRH
jgi:hypothetical protein